MLGRTGMDNPGEPDQCIGEQDLDRNCLGLNESVHAGKGFLGYFGLELKLFIHTAHTLD